jgi:hypothetical protein
MNKRIIKDKKVIAGFLTSLLLNILTIIYAVNDNNSWLIFALVATGVLSLTISRANKLYNKKTS